MILFGDGSVDLTYLICCNILAVLALIFRLRTDDKDLKLISRALFYISYATVAVGLTKLSDLRLSLVFLVANIIVFGIIVVCYKRKQGSHSERDH